MTLRRRSPGILGEVTAAYETGFDYYPSEGFVVPGSDIEDRDGMGFHVVWSYVQYYHFMGTQCFGWDKA